MTVLLGLYLGVWAGLSALRAVTRLMSCAPRCCSSEVRGGFLYISSA